MPTIIRQHGLMASDPRIDNGEPPVTKDDISIDAEPGSLAVRAAMSQQIRQARNLRRLNSVAAEIHDTCNTAHR
jgi:hypothetical protein